MKSSRLLFFFMLFVLCTWQTGHLKANPVVASTPIDIDCSYPATDALMPDVDNPCYPPDWTNTTYITQSSCTWQWQACYGAYSYTIQWRYPNGSWYNMPGDCYQTWMNVNNLQPCTAYEWRVRANCSSGYYSSWCYPYNFSTLCNSYCPSPGWLSCYNITDYSATWKWEACNGADYYSVQWCYPGGQWYDLAGGPFYGTWVNVTNLVPCTTYQWRVKSHCYNGWSYNWCNPYVFTTQCHPSCSPPYSLYTIDISDTKATLKWSSVYGANSYSVQIRDIYGQWYDVPGSPTTGLWIKVTNLTPCKTYEWRVRANCGYYESNSYWSKAKSFTTSCTYSCHAPQWIYTNGITANSASLHWDAVNGVDYYVVEWRLSGGTWTELPGPWTGTSADLHGLQSNKTYEWHVKSHCNDGHFSDWSSTTYFNTPGSTCGLPFYRYTLPITDSTATFNWSSVTGALNYTVQYRELNGAWQNVPNSPTADTSITLSGLMPNTTYEWQMQVNCNNGSYSDWLSAIKFTTGSSNGCNTPGSLATDSVTLTSATLTWAAVAGAETYSVEIRELPGGAWTAVDGSPVDTNFIAVDSLTSFTSYEWRVRANCAGGLHSFWSAGIQFTTTDASPCQSPTNLSSDSLTETSASLHWSPVADAQVYQVQIRLLNGNWIDAGTVIGDTSLVVTGLTPNTAYEWRVRAKCDSNFFSNWSSAGMFTTTGTNAGNDECVNAQVLTVDAVCNETFGSNMGATDSQPPPAGGCSTNGYQDVWFKFTMPDVQNPTVTIRTLEGSLKNAVMEVYTGADCAFQSVITCEDDNENGNGSLMPVINLTGTPNATVWVRIWGKDGEKGTFTICVLNYLTYDYQGGLNTDSPMEGIPVVVPDIAGPNTEVSHVGVPTAEASTEVDVKDQPQVVISPNPVSEQLNVSVRQTSASQVIGLRMMDLSGKIVLNQDIAPKVESQFNYHVDVSTFVPGIYMMQVQTTSGVVVEKVMVVRQ